MTERTDELLDEVVRLFALSLRQGMESQTEAILAFSQAGLETGRIAELLGTTPATRAFDEAEGGQEAGSQDRAVGGGGLTAADDEILKRLDLIQATLSLAFAPQLREARDAIRADDVNAAILDLTDDWTPSKELQQQVAKKTSKRTRSVRDRLPELVAERVLEARGTERRVEYRKTGLI